MSRRDILNRNIQREQSKLRLLYNSCSEIIKKSSLDEILTKYCKFILFLS